MSQANVSVTSDLWLARSLLESRKATRTSVLCRTKRVTFSGLLKGWRCKLAHFLSFFQAGANTGTGSGCHSCRFWAGNSLKSQ